MPDAGPPPPSPPDPQSSAPQQATPAAPTPPSLGDLLASAGLSDLAGSVGNAASGATSALASATSALGGVAQNVVQSVLAPPPLSDLMQQAGLSDIGGRASSPTSSVAPSTSNSSPPALGDLLNSAGLVGQQASNAVTQKVDQVQQAVQNVVQPTQRLSQFELGLSDADAYAACGPTAAIAFAQAHGRNPTAQEALQLAKQVGWTQGGGMNGVANEVSLLKEMGVPATLESNVNWQHVAQDASSGNPVIISTPGHYYVVDGYNPQTGQFHEATRAERDLKGGSEWMTADDMQRLMGQANGALYADNPTSSDQGAAPPTSTSPSSSTGTAAPSDTVGQGQNDFLQTLSPIAKAVQQATGIDANAMLAIAANETGWGRSQTAQQQNNLFSIQGDGSNGSRWASYSSPADAFNAFVNLISSAPRYAQAWADRADPSKFIDDLRNAGYVVDEPGFPAQGWVDQVHSIIGTVANSPVVQGAATAANTLASGVQGAQKSAQDLLSSANNLVDQGQQLASNANQGVQSLADYTQQKLAPINAEADRLTAANQTAADQTLAANQAAQDQRSMAASQAGLSPTSPVTAPLTLPGGQPPADQSKPLWQSIGDNIANALRPLVEAVQGVGGQSAQPQATQQPAAATPSPLSTPAAQPTPSAAVASPTSPLAPVTAQLVAPAGMGKQSTPAGAQIAPGGPQGLLEQLTSNLPTLPLQRPAEGTPLARSMAGEQLSPTEQLQAAGQTFQLAGATRRAAIDSLNPLRDVPVLGGLTTDLLTAVASPETYLVGAATEAGLGVAGLKSATGGLSQELATDAARGAMQNALFALEDPNATPQLVAEAAVTGAAGGAAIRGGVEAARVAGSLARTASSELLNRGLTAYDALRPPEVAYASTRAPGELPSTPPRLGPTSAAAEPVASTAADPLRDLIEQARARGIDTSAAEQALGDMAAPAPRAAADLEQLPEVQAARDAANPPESVRPADNGIGPPNEPTPPISTDPGDFDGNVENAVRRQIQQPGSFWQVLNAYHTGNIVMGPATAAKVAVNTAFAPAWNYATQTARDLLTLNIDRSMGRTVGAQQALVNMGSDFVDAFGQAMANRTTSSIPLVDAFLQAQRAVGGALHAGMQNVAAEAVRRMELGAAAGEQVAAQNGRGVTGLGQIANLISNPSALPPESIARASDLSDRAGLWSPAGATQQVVQRMLNQAANTPVGAVTNFLLPVFRIGAQAAARGIEASPIGLAGTAVDVARSAAGVGPYARGFSQYGEAVTPLADRLTNNIAGTAITGWLASKALDGTVTGSGPSDPRARANLEAQGWRPNSILVPGVGYVSYARLPEQLRTPLELAGSFGEAVKEHPEDSSGTAMALGQRVAQMLVQGLPGLQTLGDLGGILKGDPNAVGFLVGGSAAGYIPGSALLGNVATATDTFARKIPTNQGYGRAIGASIQQGIPGLREQLSPQTSLLGYEMPNAAAGLAGLLPVRTPGEVPPGTPGLQALQLLSQYGTEMPGTPTTVSDLKLTDEERAAYARARGAALDRLLPGVVSQPSFESAPLAIQQTTLRRSLTAADDEATNQLLASVPADQRRARLDQQLTEALQSATTGSQRTSAQTTHDDAVAALLYAQVPQFSGVSSRLPPEQIEAQNRAIAQAKTRLSQYRQQFGDAAENHLRHDDPQAYRLSQRDRVDAEILARKRSAIERQTGGQLRGTTSIAASGSPLLPPISPTTTSASSTQPASAGVLPSRPPRVGVTP